MSQARIRDALLRTLDDGRLSRGERSALRGLLEDAAPTAQEHAALRAEAFRLAREAVERGLGDRALDWCEDVVQLMAAVQAEAGGGNGRPAQALALFSPRQPCWRTIARLVEEARRTIDVCVFTITDSRIAEALATAHRRGCAVRIVTDDDKSQDEGSDVFRLRDAGIAVAWDRGPEHMHHKFAVFDAGTVLTGSYNWTRSAAKYNQENVVVTDDPRLVAPFRDEFERLWKAFAD